MRPDFTRFGSLARGVSAALRLAPLALLALVAAFIENGSTPEAAGGLTGLEIVRYAYGRAIADGYRFFSFGDAMLIE